MVVIRGLRETVALVVACSLLTLPDTSAAGTSFGMSMVNTRYYDAENPIGYGPGFKAEETLTYLGAFEEYAPYFHWGFTPGTERALSASASWGYANANQDISLYVLNADALQAEHGVSSYIGAYEERWDPTGPVRRTWVDDPYPAALPRQTSMTLENSEDRENFGTWGLFVFEAPEGGFNETFIATIGAGQVNRLEQGIGVAIHIMANVHFHPFNPAGGPYFLDCAPITLADHVTLRDVYERKWWDESAWDLNGDGVFDDAFGLQPLVSPEMVESWGFGPGMTWDIQLQTTTFDGTTVTYSTQLSYTPVSVPAPGPICLQILGLVGLMIGRRSLRSLAGSGVAS